jgi:hypothetical protein
VAGDTALTIPLLAASRGASLLPPNHAKLGPAGTPLKKRNSSMIDRVSNESTDIQRITELPSVAAKEPPRQLSDLPKDELEALAEDFGLDATSYKSPQLLVAALHHRRQMIATMDRDALMDVVRWGRRPVTLNAGKEQIAQEIARIKSMKFAGLSHRGLIALAQLRGVPIKDGDPVPILIKKLKQKESLFAKMSRARRAALGSMVSKIIGEDQSSAEYHYLPNPQNPAQPGESPNSIKEDIEESGLVGGLTNRIKKSADSYLNQKLDEIESRIDRKLDEIDRKLAEWRDKEIANRIRILKITLWASVIVGIVSLIYAYLKEYVPSLLGH